MVAVMDGASVGVSDIEKMALGGSPVTVVLLSAPSSGETVIDIRNFFTKTGTGPDGEPTWEDAAWQ
jgi:hypothetical protein